jgi:putative ABC transport system ATP-binding protein
VTTDTIARLEGVDFGYQRRVPVLNDFSLDIPAGSATAIVGHSGSGKSTVLYLLGLMLRPWHGATQVQGHDYASANETARAGVRADIIGFLFQDALLDTSMSVYDNVLEGQLFTRRGVDGPARDEALRLLSTFGLGELLHRSASGMSGGQAQRVALCRALLKDPVMLLADEPTGNLDDETAEEVLGALLAHAHRPGRATVIVTHDKRVAQRCDRIVTVGGDR